MSLIDVEVIYALEQHQSVLKLRMREGATVSEAIAQSGILAAHPEIDLGHSRVGVWGRFVGLDTVLRDRDRVEIYRPLLVDPKAARRRQAKNGRAVR